MSLLDDQIAAKLKDLADAGLAENTIIFYFGDNGGVQPRSKRFLQRSGTHVPLIIYFPPKWRHLAPAVPGTRITDPVGFPDFAPTVLALAGVNVPGYMQGRAFAGLARPAPPRVCLQHARSDGSTLRHDALRHGSSMALHPQFPA
jgi:N-sulfoglucosamine sulfohydrolase